MALARSSRVTQPHQPKWFQRLGALLIFGVERCLTATLRDSVEDTTGFLSLHPHQPAIFCTWHNRLALSMYAYRKHIRGGDRERRLAALVSASKDGAFMSSILESFDVQPVRGSSSRRGSQALLELTTWAERGYDLAITPDGPRGPRYRVQEGVMALAQLTGLPILPITLNLSHKICTKSWDRFQVPLPFAKCQAVVGAPLLVPRDVSDEERERLRLELEERLKQQTRD